MIHAATMRRDDTRRDVQRHGDRHCDHAPCARAAVSTRSDTASLRTRSASTGRFGAYGSSFVGIGVVWLHHHAIFRAAARVDRRMLLLDLFWLLGAAFLPFPTALVGDYLRDGGENARIAMGIYSATWVVLSAAVSALVGHILRTPGLLSPDVSREAARRFLRFIQVATVAYVLFTAVAVLSPIAVLACYVVTAVFFFWRHSDYRVLEKETVETASGR